MIMNVRREGATVPAAESENTAIVAETGNVIMRLKGTAVVGSGIVNVIVNVNASIVAAATKQSGREA